MVASKKQLILTHADTFYVVHINKKTAAAAATLNLIIYSDKQHKLKQQQAVAAAAAATAAFSVSDKQICETKLLVTEQPQQQRPQQLAYGSDSHTK